MASENFNQPDGTTLATLGGWAGDTAGLECRGGLLQPVAAWNDVTARRTAAGPNAPWVQVLLKADTFAGGEIKRVHLQNSATSRGYELRVHGPTALTLYRDIDYIATAVSPVDHSVNDSLLMIAKDPATGIVTVQVGATVITELTFTDGVPLVGGYGASGGAPEATPGAIRFDNYVDGLASSTDLGGAAAGVAGATGAASVGKALAGGAAGVGAATGAASIGKLPAGAAAGQAAATGALLSGATITTQPLKNNTGTLLANEAGATAYVYTVAGAFVVQKPGLTTNAAGVMSFTDPALTSGTTYRVVIVLASGAEGMDRIAAS